MSERRALKIKAKHRIATLRRICATCLRRGHGSMLKRMRLILKTGSC